MKKGILSCVCALGLTTSALAHEGHGTPGHGHTLQHYLLEPAHIPVAILVVATMFVGAIYFARLVNKRRVARQIPSTQNQL
jgi:hypothetical protein